LQKFARTDHLDAEKSSFWTIENFWAFWGVLPRASLAQLQLSKIANLVESDRAIAGDMRLVF
jgi:hypothetical protein